MSSTKLWMLHIQGPDDVVAAPSHWRELCRRLYVELFHCDQQMRSTRDEDGEPHWTQSAVVRDVLRDAKAALYAAPASPAPLAAAGLTDEQIERALAAYTEALETDPRNSEANHNSPAWPRIAAAMHRDAMREALLSTRHGDKHGND